MKFLDYNENKRHGSTDFPIELYSVDYKHPQYIMPLHWHKEFEIIRILSGKFTVFLNNEKYILNRGDFLIISGGTLHRGEPDSCVYECLVFDINMLKRQKNDAVGKYISPLINGSLTFKNPISPKSADLSDTLNSLFSIFNSKKPYYQLHIYSLMFFMISMLYSEGYAVPLNNKINEKKMQMMISLLSWLDENFTEEITLKMLSDITGYSEKYICRIFKEYTSRTPINYINELRIEKACHEISENNFSVTHAAYDSGFNDLSYFCRLFKDYKGVTPTQYRNLTATNKFTNDI